MAQSHHPQAEEDRPAASTRRGIAPLSSLRSRLALVMVLALVPAAFFLIFDALSISREVHAEAAADLQRLTRLAADSYGRRVDEGQRILAAIAQYPEVQTGDAAACSARLAQTAKLYYPYYLGFGVSNLAGELFCASVPLSTTVQMADRLWFREAVGTGESAIGEYTIGRTSGLPVLGLGYPVIDAAGQVTRVVSLSLSLPVLQAEADDMPLPPDAVLTVTDHNGVILVRSQGQEWIGRRQSEAVLSPMEAVGAGTVEATGVDGTKRLYAFTPIRGPSGSQVWLSIGRSPDVVYADVWQTITRDIVGMLVILLTALAAVWLAGSRLLLGRIDALVVASNQLAAGDWQARAPVHTNGDELDDLGRAFNHMADTLLQRRMQVIERERHLHLALQAARMVAWTWDPIQDRLETTDNFSTVFGVAPAQTYAGGFDWVHPDDLPGHQQIVTRSIADRTPYHAVLRIFRPDNGQVAWLDEHAAPVVDEAGNVQRLAGVTMDITERKLAETTLQEAREQAVRSAGRITRLQAFTAQLAFALTPIEVLDVVAGKGAAILNAAAASIKLLSADGAWLESPRSFNFPDDIKAAYQRYPLSAATPMADATRTGQPIWIQSGSAFTARYPNLADAVGSLELGAAAALPLVVGEHIVGAVGISFATELQFDAEEQEYLLTLASQCAQALERTRLYEAEQQARLLLEARVAERTKELERSNRELNQFAFVASHDLKAPLRAIEALAGWINEDAAAVLPPQSIDHLAKLRGRIRRMEKLLDDLLTYSRAGRVQHPVENVDLDALVQDITSVLAPPPGFAVIVEPPVPGLRTMRVSLELVLRNLIGNAIKHHHRTYGEICVHAVAQGDMVEFSVSDDGPGIAPQFHDRIFEMFQTLKPRDQVEGSGMGLAIVKKLVESYGGTIWVESAPGQGTTFHFTWPNWMNGTARAATRAA